jgi:signal transduction histidine kinase
LKERASGQYEKEVEGLKLGVDLIVGAVETARHFGKMAAPVQIKSFKLGPILERLQRVYSYMNIEWKIQSELSMTGDPSLIEETVVELLTNAIRFTRGRTGVISVSAYRHTAKITTGLVRKAVIIRVNNNGPSIPADQKQRIFDPAVTTDPAAHFGLGLSFVQNVAQRHGGYAEECGKAGKGASFRVVFPQ